MRDPTVVTAAVRAFTYRPRDGRRTHPEATPEPPWPKYVLVFDTETSTDPSQRLLFGFYRFCAWKPDPSLEVLEEGIIHADDLPGRDPEGFVCLNSYALSMAAEVGGDYRPTIAIRSRSDFVERVLWRTHEKCGGLIVGFNLPFDLSRIALSASAGRGKYRNGFSLCLWDYEDKKTGTRRERSRVRPRIRIKHRDSKSSFISFSRIPQADRRHHPGRFLDLKTLCFALADRGLGLGQACDLFGASERKSESPEHGRITLESIAYARQDVRATAALLVAARHHFDAHPIRLVPWKARSPASIAKAYLREMGILPGLQKFAVSDRVQAIAMMAYYGGRAEARIRRQTVPVVYVDFLSMYPTVNALMDLWSWIVGGELHETDATDEVRSFLASVTPTDLFKPATWPALTFFAEVEPDGDVLPIRARYDEDRQGRNIALSEITSSGPTLWYAGPDLVASLLLTGKAPRIKRAVRLIPHGVQEGLRSVKLSGIVPVDPTKDDFFRLVIEQRKGLGRLDLSTAARKWVGQSLKTIANSGSYGVFAEFNRDDGPSDKAELRVCAPWGSHTEKVEKPEEPGSFCFPPLASLITSAARLMLALLEKAVTDAGGSYAFCDTDSMAIVATKSGGPVACAGGPLSTEDGIPAVRALSWGDVEQIRERFSQLTPYQSPELRGTSILKIEDENFCEGKQREISCWAISAKRNALFLSTAEGIEFVRDPSEHGLGHVLRPTGKEEAPWYPEVWRHLLGLEGVTANTCEPIALDTPALSRTTISSPVIAKAFASINEGRAYSDQVKPSNFVLVGHVGANGFPVGTDPSRFHPIAPYSTDPKVWRRAKWMNLYDGKTYHATTRTPAPPGMIRLRTHRDILEEYRTHPEAKSAAPDGRPCGRNTLGLLGRRRLAIGALEFVGKESNQLEDVEAGRTHDLEDVQTCYQVFDENDWRKRVVPRLRAIGPSELANLTGLSREHLSRVLSGRKGPSPILRRRLATLI